MKKWRLVGGVILVFALGVLVGSVGTRVYRQYRLEHFWRDPAVRRAAFLEKMTRDLRLTEEQQKEFMSIIDDVDKKVEAVRRDARAEIKKTFDESFVRMKEKLNPDQQQRIEELRARHERHWAERKKRTFFP